MSREDGVRDELDRRKMKRENPATDHAAVIREALICPEHKMRDCSPLLNGCSKVNALHAALAALEAELAEAKREREEARAEADIDQRQCDAMTSFAGVLAERTKAAEAEVARLRDLFFEHVGVDA